MRVVVIGSQGHKEMFSEDEITWNASGGSLRVLDKDDAVVAEYANGAWAYIRVVDEGNFFSNDPNVKVTSQVKAVGTVVWSPDNDKSLKFDPADVEKAFDKS